METGAQTPSTIPAAAYCGHCGEAVGAPDARDHERCAARLELEPPRYCGQCHRRMVVQVVPTGWSAKCVEHGTIASA